MSVRDANVQTYRAYGRMGYIFGMNDLQIIRSKIPENDRKWLKIGFL